MLDPGYPEPRISAPRRPDTPLSPPRGRRSDRGNAARAGEPTVTARGHGSCRPHNRFSRHWPPEGWSLWKTRVTAGPDIPSVAFAGQGPVPLAMSTPRTGHHRERIPWTRSGHGERSGTGTGRWCVPRCLEGPCNAMAWHASSSSRPFRTRDLTLIWRQWPPKPRLRRGACPLLSHRPRASRRPPPLCPSPPPSCSPSR